MYCQNRSAKCFSFSTTVHVQQLAESFTTEDNMTFTITLREGATWSDGVPVTAEVMPRGAKW